MAQCNLELKGYYIFFARNHPQEYKRNFLSILLVPAFCWLSSLTYAYLRCSLWIAQSEYKSNVELMTDQVYPKSDFPGTWNQLKNGFKASWTRWLFFIFCQIFGIFGDFSKFRSMLRWCITLKKNSNVIWTNIASTQ